MDQSKGGPFAFFANSSPIFHATPDWYLIQHVLRNEKRQVLRNCGKDPFCLLW